MQATLGVLAALTLSGVSALDARDDGHSVALVALPSCTSTCLNQVLQTTACNDNDNCICTDTAFQNDLKTCVLSSCSPDDQIAAAKLQADTCGFPVRDQSSVIAGVTWALFAVATIFVIIRILARWPRLRGAGFSWDDWTLFSCFPFAVAIAVAVQFDIKAGYGRDAWELSSKQIENFLYWFYICQPLYLVVTFGSKLSLVLLYLRTWEQKILNRFRVACWIVVTALILTIIATVFATIFQCMPVRYNWSMIIAEASTYCTDRTAQVYAIAGLNILFDVIVLLLPFPILLKLDISLARKLGLCLIFLTGFVVTICSGIRIKYMSKFANSDNVTWDYTEIGIWSVVEVYLSIICACMPATVGLIKRCVDYALNHLDAIETTSLEGDIEEQPEMARILAMSKEPGCICCSRHSNEEKLFYPSSIVSSEISPPPSAVTKQSPSDDEASLRGPLDLESQTLAKVRHELTWEAPAPQLAQVYRPEHVRVRYVPART